MTHTPADVQVMAAYILGQHNGASTLDYIAQAILAERERCADVAFDYFKGDAYGSNYRDAGNLVGSAILSGAA